MVLKLPPIIDKVMGLKELKYDSEGNLLLWNTAFILSPIEVNLMKTRLYEELFGLNESRKVEYFVGKIQAKTGMKIVNKKFGYAETIPDKKKLVEFNNGQFELLGHGRFKIIRQDVTNSTVVVKTKSQYAKEYKSLFGLQKNPVDSFIAGLWAGTIEQIYGIKAGCIEIKCLAKGDQFCEFLIKGLTQFNKADSNVKKNKFIFEEEIEKRIEKSWRVLFN